MSYTAKTWRTLNDFKVNDLNSLERGVQEAHEGVDLLRKDFTTTKIAQDKAISQINSLLNQSGTALQAIKDIENILVSDKELSEVLKNYGTEFLSKEPQSLSNDELKNVYKNLKLNEYKLFTSVTINGEEVIGNSLDIKSPELDTILNRSSNNAVTNAAITQALENFSSPDINRYLNIHNESTTAHANLRDQINSKASIDYVNDVIKNIPVPDVSKQISEHNSDTTSHQDIRDMLNNLDLSGYAKVDHNHDNVYSTIHSHPYAHESHNHDDKYSLKHEHPYAPDTHSHPEYSLDGHTHNYATQDDIDNAISNIKLPEIDFDGLATEDFVSEAIKDLASTAYVDGAISNHANDKNAHSDIRNSVTNIQTSVNTINGLLSSFAKSEDVVKKSGDTMTGTLTLGNITLNPTTNTIATKNLSLTNLSEVSSASKLVVLDTNNNAQYRTLTGLKSDLNITNDINTAVQGVKDWLLGTGNADTIDTIKDIADIMEEHKDVLDTLGNTYALKDHSHNYLPLTGGTVNGTVSASTIVSRGDVQAQYVQASAAGHETGTYDKIATLSSTGYIRYRTKAELKSDLGVPTDYAPSSHTHDYAPSSHTHDYSSTYAAKSHTHTEYAPASETPFIQVKTGSDTASLSSYWFPLWKQTKHLAQYSDVLYKINIGNRYNDSNTGRGVLAFGFRNNSSDGSSYNYEMRVESGNLDITKFKMYKRSDNMFEVWACPGAQWAFVIGNVSSITNRTGCHKTDPYGTFMNTSYSSVQTPSGTEIISSAGLQQSIYKGTSSTKESNTTKASLRLGLVGSTLYIWTS